MKHISKNRNKRITILLAEEEAELLKKFMEEVGFSSYGEVFREALSCLVKLSNLEDFQYLSTLLKKSSSQGGRPKGSKQEHWILDEIYDSIKKQKMKPEDMFDHIRY